MNATVKLIAISVLATGALMVVARSPEPLEVTYFYLPG